MTATPQQQGKQGHERGLKFGSFDGVGGPVSAWVWEPQAGRAPRNAMKGKVVNSRTVAGRQEEAAFDAVKELQGEWRDESG